MSKDICKKCVSNAPNVCSIKCGTVECSHDQVKDPKVTCGATSFAMHKCLNYSKKIAEYHGGATTLYGRRLNKIRQCFVKYVKDNKDDGISESLYILLSKMGKLTNE